MANWHNLLLFLSAQAFILGSGYRLDEAKAWISRFARYFAYIIVVTRLQEVYSVVPQLLRFRSPNWGWLWDEHKPYFLALGACVGYVYMLSNQFISYKEFLALFVASHVYRRFYKFLNRPTISYGAGMACSFFEGYLKMIFPPDETADSDGFEANIRAFEAEQGVVFPVRKLLLVVPQSFCPPDLNHYNDRNDPHAAYIEALAPLNAVTRDVAGLRNRCYRNAAYKIYRPPPALPVCVAVEGATPLHTLYSVLRNRDVYEELCDLDQAQLKRDFCRKLEDIIERCPDTRGRCHLIHFDDTAANANLADAILAKVFELEPSFEDILRLHHAHRQVKGEA